MHTTATLAEDLTLLGLPRGALLLLHSGYRALGPVEGGPNTVIAALREVLGPEGTLAAPNFTTHLIDPASWPSPPPPEERERLMAAMPSFDPARTEPHHMGAIATALWKTPGAVRSRHPVTSWSAIGPDALRLTRDHPLDDPEGVDGPLGRAWKSGGWVLLLGVDHDADTTIHLAESLLEMPHLLELPDRWPDDSGGERVWRSVRKTTKCSDGFVKFRLHLQRAGKIVSGRVGDAEAQLLRSDDIVQTALSLLSRDPVALLCDDPGCVHCPTSRRALAGWSPA